MNLTGWLLLCGHGAQDAVALSRCSTYLLTFVARIACPSPHRRRSLTCTLLRTVIRAVGTYRIATTVCICSSLTVSGHRTLIDFSLLCKSEHVLQLAVATG